MAHYLDFCERGWESGWFDDEKFNHSALKRADYYAVMILRFKLSLTNQTSTSIITKCTIKLPFKDHLDIIQTGIREPHLTDSRLTCWGWKWRRFCYHPERTSLVVLDWSGFTLSRNNHVRCGFCVACLKGHIEIIFTKVFTMVGMTYEFVFFKLLVQLC